MTTSRTASRGYVGVRSLFLIATLAAVIIAWATAPIRDGAYPRIALICAGVFGLAGLAQLAIAGAPEPEDLMSTILEQLVGHLITGIRALPWAELMTVAVLWLEAQHPARPWHTGVLGVALLGYLLALHLAESRARAGVLRPQLPLLAAGIGIAALAVGAAAVPTLPSGSVSAVVKVIAASAAIVAGCLAVPVWLGRQHER